MGIFPQIVGQGANLLFSEVVRPTSLSPIRLYRCNHLQAAGRTFVPPLTRCRLITRRLRRSRSAASTWSSLYPGVGSRLRNSPIVEATTPCGCRRTSQMMSRSRLFVFTHPPRWCFAISVCSSKLWLMCTCTLAVRPALRLE